jgi:hypothetical protein
VSFETVTEKYPLPWRWVEEWTCTRIVAANNRPVVMIRLGREGARIEEERALAETIIAAMNQGVVAS